MPKKFGKDIEIQVVDEVLVNVYCYECGEEIEIKDIASTGYKNSTTTSIDVGIAPHKCKEEAG